MDDATRSTGRPSPAALTRRGPREYLNQKPSHGATVVSGRDHHREGNRPATRDLRTPSFAMVKVGCGYNADGAEDWEWYELQVDATDTALDPLERARPSGGHVVLGRWRATRATARRKPTTTCKHPRLAGGWPARPLELLRTSCKRPGRRSLPRRRRARRASRSTALARANPMPLPYTYTTRRCPKAMPRSSSTST